MNSHKKSTFALQGDDSVGQEQAPVFRVETGVRAGWVPGSNARETIRNMRASAPSGASAPEIR